MKYDELASDSVTIGTHSHILSDNTYTAIRDTNDAYNAIGDIAGR